MLLTRRSRTIYLDTETTGLKWTDAAYSWPILWGDRSVFYCEWKVDPHTRQIKTNPNEVEQIQNLIYSAKKIVFANAPFDLRRVAIAGIRVPEWIRIEDVLFAGRITNNLELANNLKELAHKYCGFPKQDRGDLKRYVTALRKAAKALGWAIHEDIEADYWLCQYVDVLLPKLLPVTREQIKKALAKYALSDVVRTRAVWNHMEEKLDADPLFRAKYEEELILRPVIRDMVNRGVRVNREEVVRQNDEVKAVERSSLKELQDMAKKRGFKDLNPNSPVQISRLLFTPQGFGLQPSEYTKTGRISTKDEVLSDLDHPFVDVLLNHRAAAKASSSFFEPFLEHMVEEEGQWIIHPQFGQCTARTGRMGCSLPNLQNIEKDDTGDDQGLGIKVRAAFEPRPGYEWWLFDYAQMELRMFADLGDVRSMLKAIREGRDLNDENANRAWGGKGNPSAIAAASRALELDHANPRPDVATIRKDCGFGLLPKAEVCERWLSKFNYEIVAAEKSLGLKISRDNGKIIIYSKLYGGGPNQARRRLKTTLRGAQALWREYDQRYPEIERLQNKLSSQAYICGYIVTPFGRKLWVDKDFLYRATNYMIQGGCADLLKTAKIGVARYLKQSGLDAHLVLTIHDELVIEIKSNQVTTDFLRPIPLIMSDHGGRLRVPMSVEASRVTTRWNEKEVVKL